MEILNTTTALPNFSTWFGHLILSSALSHFLSALQLPGQLPGQGLAACTQPYVEAAGALVCPLGLLSSEVCSPKRQAWYQIALSSLQSSSLNRFGFCSCSELMLSISPSWLALASLATQRHGCKPRQVQSAIAVLSSVSRREKHAVVNLPTPILGPNTRGLDSGL